MPIDPRIVASSGDASGIASRLADLQRQLNGLNAVRTQIGPGSLNGSHLGYGAISSAHLIAGAVTAGTIAAGAVTTGSLAADAVTANNIAANAIQTIHLAAGSVVTNSLAAGSVTAQIIAADSIQTIHLAAGSVTADELTVGAVRAVHIQVDSLAAITANLGLINFGTGVGSIQTASSGNRVVLDSAGLRGYVGGGATLAFDINAGSGIASFTGIALLDSNSTVPSKTLTGFIGGGNMLSDSSFESTDPAKPTSFWTGYGVTTERSAEQAFHDGKSLKVVRSSGTDSYAYLYSYDTAAFPINPTVRLRGKPVVFSAWVYVPAATKASGLVGPDRSLLLNDGVTGPELPISNIPADTWTRVVGKHVIGLGTGNIDMRLYNAYNAGAVYYDGVQLEIGEAATAYAPKTDEILYASIRSQFIGAGEIKTNNLDVGAVKAQNISVSFGGSNVALNSNFKALVLNEETGNPPPGIGVAWTRQAGSSARDNTVIRGGQEWSFRLGNSTGSLNEDTYVSQDFTLPVGLWTFSAWAKADAVVLGAGAYGVVMNLDVTSGAIEKADNLPSMAGQQPHDTLVGSGTFDWVRTQRTIRVTSPAVVRLYLQKGFGGPTTGRAWWSEVQVEAGEFATGYAPAPDEILPGSIGNTKITPNSIQADKIVAVSLAAVQANVTSLSSITANIGNITTGTLTGVTITGSTVRTAASGARVELNSGGLIAYNGAGTPVVTISSADGSFTATNGSITGATITGGVVRSANASARVQMDSTGLFATSDNGATKTFELTAAGGYLRSRGIDFGNTTTSYSSTGAIRWANTGDASFSDANTIHCTQASSASPNIMWFVSNRQASDGIRKGEFIFKAGNYSMVFREDGMLRAQGFTTGYNTGGGSVDVRGSNWGPDADFSTSRIVSDTSGYTALMIAGNRSRNNGVRNIRLYDDVIINRHAQTLETFRCSSNLYADRNTGNNSGSDANIEMTNGGGIPRISFHRPGIVRQQIGMYDDGRLVLLNDSNTAHPTMFGYFSSPSDRRMKENFKLVDGRNILAKIKTLPIYHYTWKEDKKAGIGPTAQDFHETFPWWDDVRERMEKPLEDEDGIHTENAGGIEPLHALGIAFAAIKELTEKVEALERRNQRR